MMDCRRPDPLPGYSALPTIKYNLTLFNAHVFKCTINTLPRFANHQSGATRQIFLFLNPVKGVRKAHFVH